MSISWHVSGVMLSGACNLCSASMESVKQVELRLSNEHLTPLGENCQAVEAWGVSLINVITSA